MMKYPSDSKEKKKEYYERWKAKKLAADPDFFKHEHQRKLGIYGREYFNANSKKSRKAHPDTYKNWCKNHPDYFTPKRKEWRKRTGKHNAEYVAKWHREHPESYEVNKKMACGIREKVPLAEFCEVCPDDDRRKATQRHHPDYDYPTIIVSCCSACHHFLNKQRIEESSNKMEASK